MSILRVLRVGFLGGLPANPCTEIVAQSSFHGPFQHTPHYSAIPLRSFDGRETSGDPYQGRGSVGSPGKEVGAEANLGQYSPTEITENCNSLQSSFYTFILSSLV